MDHYLRALLYPAGLTREAQWALGAGGLAVNGAVYGFLLGRWARPAGAEASRVSVRAWRGVVRWRGGGRSGQRWEGHRATRSYQRRTSASGWRSGTGNWRGQGRGRGAFGPPRRLGGGSPGRGDRGAVPGDTTSGRRSGPAGPAAPTSPAMGALYAAGDRSVALKRNPRPGRGGQQGRIAR